ncbi:MAG: hypothetical protein NC120_09285 [Ruminococcus sp.]|nr:hypothetical protein [Ruminococcus sp.]
MEYYKFETTIYSSRHQAVAEIAKTYFSKIGLFKLLDNYSNYENDINYKKQVFNQCNKFIDSTIKKLASLDNCGCYGVMHGMEICIIKDLPECTNREDYDTFKYVFENRFTRCSLSFPILFHYKPNECSIETVSFDKMDKRFADYKKYFEKRGSHNV